jgi:hypothetical protein
MFRCDICKKEKPDTDVGVIRRAAAICWHLLLAPPFFWFATPPEKVCKACESRANASPGYVAILVGVVLLALAIIPLANWAYSH